MTIPLNELIPLAYPTAVLFPSGGWNVLLADLNDGNGPFIDTWNVPNITMPSSSDLTALQTQYASQFSNNQLQSQGTAAIQNLLDTTAQSKQYNDA